GLADRRDAPVADANVRLVDAGDIEDEGVRDHEIGRAGGARRGRRLPHPVANHLAAAELGLVSVGRGVVFDLDDEIGVGQADAVSGRGTVVIRVRATVDSHSAALTNSSTAASASARTLSASSGPSTSWFNPNTSRVPPSATSSTSRVSPG